MAKPIAIDMSCTSPIQAWQRRKDGAMFFDKPSHHEVFLYKHWELPCRQCLSCRTSHASSWSLRIMHEASMHERNCVVTLTYDDAHLPHRGMLRYSDVQKFIRALRKRHPGMQLLYVCGGEYGTLNWRPHYHLIFMGYDPEDRTDWKKAGDGSQLSKSKSLESLWGLGSVLVGELTRESAGYVASYCLEKRTGELAKVWYRRVDAEGEFWLPSEFICVSKGRAQPGEVLPFGRGIGARWLEKYFSDVFPADHVVMRGGAELKPPRYYDKLLKRRDAAAFEAIRAKREAEAQAPERLADETPERRGVRAEVVKARVGLKHRDL